MEINDDAVSQELNVLSQRNTETYASIQYLDALIIRAGKLAGSGELDILISPAVSDILLTAVENSRMKDGSTDTLLGVRILLAATMRMSSGCVEAMRRIASPGKDTDESVVI